MTEHGDVSSGSEPAQHTGDCTDSSPAQQQAAPMCDKADIVFWEATVTGRRLIDEMINLGAYHEGSDGAGSEFNEYVMPYGKLPLNVIRNYNLRIVDTGRYRMLKEVRANRMLKSKSEVAACNDFAAWMSQLHKERYGGDGDKKMVLVFFEPRHSKILQLFQNLERFRLLDDVKKVLLGCVNAWDLLKEQVNEIKDEHRMVLKALAERHLGEDTLLETAGQRARALHKILNLVNGGRIDASSLKEHLIECDSLLDEVRKIKEELMKEAQWRPVFADMFRQGVKPRRRAGFLRHLLVESALSYSDVALAFKEKKEDGMIEVIKEKVKGKNDADVDEVIKLLNAHLTQPERPVRRGSGRRGPRTRSVCVSELDKMAAKSEANQEENNNDLKTIDAVNVATTVPAEAP